MALGKQIKRYRTMLGWTLAQLSMASDVDVGTISALELRDSKRSQFFMPLAQAMGLTLEQLADEKTKYKPNPPPLMHRGNKALENLAVYDPTKGTDVWLTEAITTLQKLNEADRRAAVLNLRRFVKDMDPHSDGQALSLAG